MLEPLLGSKSAERVLLFILAREQGYAREIARYWSADADSIQKQLVRLELGGVLDSKSEGRTKIYRFNPRYVFRDELAGLLSKALLFYPKEERERLVRFDLQPRRIRLDGPRLRERNVRPPKPNKGRDRAARIS